VKRERHLAIVSIVLAGTAIGLAARGHFGIAISALAVAVIIQISSLDLIRAAVAHLFTPRGSQ
jgi:hypothetical protein